MRRWEQVHLPAKPSEGGTSFLVVTPPHVSDDCAAEESKGFSRKQEQGLLSSSLQVHTLLSNLMSVFQGRKVW